MTKASRFKDSVAPFVGTYSRYAQREHGVTSEVGAFDVVAYDNETSGTDHRHGQIYQFGCVRADKDLVPCDRYEINVRRLPYVVPSPGALRVTGIDPDALDAPDRFEEFEAARRIANVLDFPPGVTTRLFLTYNGIKFDDRLIAATLARNLQQTGYASNPRTQGHEFPDPDKPLTACRMDMLPVVRLAVALAPDRIRHEFHEDGKVNFKLESIAACNGIAFAAHDAMGDAGATLELARLVKDRVPEAWTIARRSMSQGLAIRCAETMAARDEALYMFTSFGDIDVVPFKLVAVNRKRLLLADLRRLGDPLPEGLAPRGLAGLAWGKDAHAHVVAAGECPLFMTEEEARPFLDGWDVRSHRSLMGRLAQGEHAERLAELKTRFEANEYGPGPDDPTSEEEPPFPFPNRDDTAKMRRFRKAEDWVERARIEFEKPGLRDYASRLVAMNCDLDALARLVGERRVAEIRRDSARAFARPFDPAGSRWPCLADALADEAVDDAFRDWAGRSYDPAATHPGLVPEPEAVDPQPSFGF